ncbi:hypothetical protein ACTVZO_17615 [Streptomyces sp. IBSNAI002]|uniref:hypothetical protein n=1 Tax=Streptomyces sp. IBSNAI002 TaxID=3457500 RepID=UPI003FD5FF6D
MRAWLSTNRRLRSEVAHLREELAKAKEQPAPLVVTSSLRPGPRPGPTPAATPPAHATRTEEEERLRGEVRALRELSTLPGSLALARDRRTWRERAGALDELLCKAQKDNESLDRDLRAMTARATAAEQLLQKVSRTAELRVGPA